MKRVSFRINPAPGSGFSDFLVGRYQLAKHFGTAHVGVLDVDPRYARQLLLSEPSDFPSFRVPLYVCELCGDLDCGAITVHVSRAPDGIVWRDFGTESPSSGGPRFDSDVLARTGPLVFDEDEYRRSLIPFTRRR